MLEVIRSVLSVKANGSSLPVFGETKDDLDVYLRRFELFAQTAKWPRESWGISLSSHLEVVALVVCARLSEEDMSNYDSVKRAPMDRFECTEEGF